MPRCSYKIILIKKVYIKFLSNNVAPKIVPFDPTLKQCFCVHHSKGVDPGMSGDTREPQQCAGVDS